MKIPLTKYGMPQVALYPAYVIAVMAAVAWAGKFMPLSAVWITEGILFCVLIWILAFFRDPPRQIPAGDELFLSPADGMISDIETLETSPLGCPAVRIGIFLNVFNVHINRAPCSVTIEKIEYKQGQFKNALDPESARVNESNDIYMTRIHEPKAPLLVRQISGAIARRIVCKISTGENLSGGQQFGMIKFGSRTELYIPAGEKVECQVKIGEKVKAGITILAKYTLCPPHTQIGTENASS